MSQVNLLPPEVLQDLKTRRTTLLVVAAGGVVMALIILFYMLQVGALGDVQGDIEAQEASNATLSQEIADLQKFEDLQVEAQAKQDLLQAAFADEVSFSGMLMDLSRVIPPDAYLTTFTAQVTAAAATEAPVVDTAAVTGFVGTLAADGQGSGVESVATWLTRLEQLRGWVNPWVSSVTAAEGTSGVSFSTGVDLTPEVLTDRGRGEGAIADA
jgi:Tfp pilus assembly protein PilN